MRSASSRSALSVGKYQRCGDISMGIPIPAMCSSSTWPATWRAVLAAGLLAAFALDVCPAAKAGDDYRSRMQAVNIAAAMDGLGKPDLSLLPTRPEWVTHIAEDLLPYWTSTIAIGNPAGNFP